ncbi:hypothetical protein KO488_08045 [Poseidonibacter lekithochrous]|uniref:hypothetical protein n=1 Tax=Poseidonibacter TaxID=2321187 RepID=UPI001C09D3D5|nr:MULTISPECIES: hypothetical protein [Poseidonibacter]MBU3014704.1 hypothetical protein [Poseidonibacter lekithochrous]MDO6828002.1 hypothetical protein [Poseidonibacter sp. 1_MG-2023]
MCNFYKTMNRFFAKLAMFTVIASVFTFVSIIIYGLYILVFNIQTSYEFNDVALLISFVIIPLIAAINIIGKFEADTYLKEINH